MRLTQLTYQSKAEKQQGGRDNRNLDCNFREEESGVGVQVPLPETMRDDTGGQRVAIIFTADGAPITSDLFQQVCSSHNQR